MLLNPVLDLHLIHTTFIPLTTPNTMATSNSQRRRWVFCLLNIAILCYYILICTGGVANRTRGTGYIANFRPTLYYTQQLDHKDNPNMM